MTEWLLGRARRPLADAGEVTEPLGGPP